MIVRWKPMYATWGLISGLTNHRMKCVRVHSLLLGTVTTLNLFGIYGKRLSLHHSGAV